MINLLQHVITQVYSTKKGIYQGEQTVWRVGSTGLTACWPTFRYNYPSIYLPSLHTCCLCNLSIILSTVITPQQASQASQYHLHSSLINSPSFIWNMSICSTDQKSLYTTKAAVKVILQFKKLFYSHFRKIDTTSWPCSMQEIKKKKYY